MIMIDLSKSDLDASGKDYKVAKIVRAEDYGFDITKYYNNGMLPKLKFPSF